MKSNTSNRITEGCKTYVFNFLIDRDIKLTQQRKDILSVLHENKGQHLTTEEIYQIIKDKKNNKSVWQLYIEI